MRALIIDGENTGKTVQLTESVEQSRFLEKLNIDEIVEKDAQTGAYKMNEEDVAWFKEMPLRESAVKPAVNEQGIPDIETEHYILGVMKRTALDGKEWWNLRATQKWNADKPFSEWGAVGKYKTKKAALEAMNWEAEHDYK